MKKALALAGLCALLAVPAYAQQPAQPQAGADAAAEAPTKEEAAAAAKSIEAFADDAKKAEGYCAITKEMAGVAETDTKKTEELGKKMDDYLNAAGAGTAEAFGIAEAVDPESEEGKKIDAAFTKLEGKCGGA
jgi:opacity protein-like surface antigen